MKKIIWLIPELINGSGGHRTILSHAKCLEESGKYECILFFEPGKYLNPNEVRNDIKVFFSMEFKSVYLGFEPTIDADLIFATVWFSAKFVRDNNRYARKAYFVQDYEAWFNPMGDAYLLAESSYTYGLIPVSIGNWLRSVMHDRFGVKGYSFDFCATKSIYNKKEGLNKNNKKSVCFIYQPDKPRRCAKIGIDALGIVKHYLPEVEIFLYGSTSVDNIWFEHSNLKIISEQRCAELYNSCSVGLCISSSNPSRIPFEMMGCGLPVVDVYRDNNLFDMPDDAVLLAEPNSEAIASALMYILSNEDVAKKMSIAGISFMENKDNQTAYKQFINIVDDVIEGDSISNIEDSRVEKLYNGNAFKLDKNLLNEKYQQYDLVSHKMRIKLFIKKILRKYVSKKY